MAKVSVIIPTHDRPHLLSRAVESARAAGTDVEIIVVDDASTDATAEVCRHLSDLKYVRVERNQGVAGARNIGVFVSTEKYVAFLDDDDLRLPGSLDLQVAALEANPEAGFACGAMVMADQNYQPTGEVIHPKHPSGDVFWQLLELDFPVMPLCSLIRKECFLRVGLLNRNISSIDDWDIFTRIAELYTAVVIRGASRTLPSTYSILRTGFFGESGATEPSRAASAQTAAFTTCVGRFKNSAAGGA